jgi:predicted DNA-binding transcriptional regulator YafY
MYNNAWFVLGFDESKGDIRYFKLNRIQDFAVQHRKFVQLLTYKESDYLDEYGMKNNGEWYPIKLKLTGNYAMLVKERVYGKDQKIEEVDEKTTILSCKMQNRENILVFVLGFGDNCEVLEPVWLKEKLLETINKIVVKCNYDMEDKL